MPIDNREVQVQFCILWNKKLKEMHQQQHIQKQSTKTMQNHIRQKETS